MAVGERGKVRLDPVIVRGGGRRWSSRAAPRGFLLGIQCHLSPVLTSCSRQVEPDGLLRYRGWPAGEQALGRGLKSSGMPLVDRAVSYPCGVFTMNVTEPTMMC